jgi:hypothetical protein
VKKEGVGKDAAAVVRDGRRRRRAGRGLLPPAAGLLRRSEPPRARAEPESGNERERVGARVSGSVLTLPIVPLNRRIGIRRPGARGERRYRRALGHLGLGRKRVRQPVTAALGAKRAKQATGHVWLRAKLSFLLLFYTES